MLNFDNGDIEFPLPSSSACVWSARSEKEKIKNKKLTNELWQCHCRNRGIKKNFSNCGNGIAENGEKKKGYEIYERVKKKSCHVHNIFTTFSQ